MKTSGLAGIGKIVVARVVTLLHKREESYVRYIVYKNGKVKEVRQ